MQISSDNVKAAIYAALAVGAVYMGFRVYTRMTNFGGDAFDALKFAASDVGQNLSQAADKAIQAVKDIPAVASAAASGFANDVKRTVGAASEVRSETNAEFVAPKYIKQLPIASWDTATKQFIKTIAKARGTYKTGLFGFDYEGWQVFEDGTIISPWGDYYQMDYTNAAMDSQYGFAVNGIYSSADSPWLLASYNISDFDPSIVDLSLAEGKK